MPVEDWNASSLGVHQPTAVLVMLNVQLLAYYIAVLRGTNVDQPRNLSNSVTVE
jgi:glucosamine 6-phosphate synthetase-like amidotransferase/phosphosugar isomerase protein